MGEIDGDDAELGWRHQALVDRDRVIGLQAEAEAARAQADRLGAKLDDVRERLARKNARIEQLTARIAELESEHDGGGDPLRARVARLVRRRP